ncbi:MULTISPECIES: hypothetical protein [unclassified Sphingobacterium]|uniref:hypothetical protein n=1 Tax=unclassified Sphingobacterium TaxID=2609468 RepID=UPI0025DD6138|nr:MULTISPECIES: hypothetical protein [unclassified Sphingobacterium]
MNKKRLFTILFALTFVLLTSCISRLRRPEITGKVLDYNNNPIPDCHVGEAVTDSLGNFVLPEQRYNAFLLTEIFYMEAPPMHVGEIIEKPGYESDEIEMFSRYGGGRGKGAKMDVGNIYLRKINEKINIPQVLQGEWLLSANKQLDTLYLVHSKMRELYTTSKFQNFYSLYEQYTDNYLRSFGPDNLPEGTIRKFNYLEFCNDRKIRLTKIIQHGNKDGRPSIGEKNIPNDTLQFSGTWNMVNDTTLHFATDDKELNSTYQILQSDKSFFQLRKSK